MPCCSGTSWSTTAEAPERPERTFNHRPGYDRRQGSLGRRLPTQVQPPVTTMAAVRKAFDMALIFPLRQGLSGDHICAAPGIQCFLGATARAGDTRCHHLGGPPPQEIAASISSSDMPVMTRSTSSTLVFFGSMSSATTLPRRITTMRSTTWKTWWMLCAMKMHEWPESRHCARKRAPLRLGDAEIVGRLVKDDQVAVEMHGAGDGHRLALAARQRAYRRRRRDVLGNADLSQQIARDRVHRILVHAVEKPRTLQRLAAEEQVAGDRQLRHQRGVW